MTQTSKPYGIIAEFDTPADVMQPGVMRDLFGFEAEPVEVSGRQWVVPRV